MFCHTKMPCAWLLWATLSVKVHVPNIRAYDRLLNEVLFRIPGMKHVKSSFTLREVKYDTALPLPEGERR